MPMLNESMKKVKTLRLPSTSPAMAMLSKEEKLKEWSVLIPSTEAATS